MWLPVLRYGKGPKVFPMSAAFVFVCFSDGVQMLVLSDDDIEQLPGLTELQRKAFSMELYAIREHGMKAPYTVAEFRVGH